MKKHSFIHLWHYSEDSISHPFTDGFLFGIMNEYAAIKAWSYRDMPERKLMMRLVVLRNELEKFLTTQYKLDPLFEEDKDFMVAKCSIKFRDFDDSVYLRITAYDNGSATIAFIFDKIDLTLETMLRINAFNENIHWLKAYVNENSFLAFKHPIIDAVIESNVVEALGYLIKIFTNEETKKHLTPLTELTYAE